MSFWQLLKRDVLFYRRSGLGTLLLAAVCSAILTGAMLVGDSVTYSLRRLAHMRLGSVQYACNTGERFFDCQLAKDLTENTSGHVAGVLTMKGILESADGSVRISNIHVYGIDKQFGTFSTAPRPLLKNGIDPDTAWINEAVKARLGDDVPDQLLLRLETTSQLSKDLIFSTEGSDTSAYSVAIAGTIPDDALGRFSLQTLQEPPLNVFVPIDWLAEKAGISRKANMLLMNLTVSTPANVLGFIDALKETVTLEDYGLTFHNVDPQNVFEVRTPQVFIDDRVADGLLQSGQGAYGVFTYFVNDIKAGDRTTPYSMVAGLDARSGLSLADDEIAINEWLANDLKIDEGDSLELTYYQVTPTRKLIEQTHTFTVARVVPMMGPFADASLMPDFPGLSEAEDCRNWDTGLPIDLDKIRDKDEAYWDTYRGTPKAFISLAAAQSLWGNHFGKLTAIRWSAADNTEASIRRSVRQTLDPIAAGFSFEDVRTAAGQSAAGSTDFAGLFAGLSMFLIFSTAILLGLVFVFYVESRSAQIGILQAVGWSWLKIFALFIAQGAIVAAVGCCLGAVLSVLYTAGLIRVLNATFWAQALANLQLVFHASAATLLSGMMVSLLICVFAIQIALYHRIRKPIVQLLTGTFESYRLARRDRFQLSGWIGVVCLGIGLLLPIQVDLKQSEVTVFFLSGVLLLVGAFLLAHYGLQWLRLKSRSFAQSLPLLAIKNIPRRTGRSLTVLITLACGVFMVVSVGANHKDIGDAVHERNSGTGGFALLAHTTVPMTETPQLQRIDDVPPVPQTAVVPFRQYTRDDASCLNLNRASQPTLLGVDPIRLADKQAFAFRETIKYDEDEVASPWLLLNQTSAGDTLPAIGDYATVMWGLHKKIGDTLAYRDETGDTVLLKIVGILQESVLQGRLIIAEDDFVRHFPSVDGKSVFLIDADPMDFPIQAKEMTRKYRDYGMEMVPAAEKLAQYNEVENTYMAIFLILGGLGLVLGSAGLGLVLVLNVLDRSGELAMMQAVGFRKTGLTKILFIEHGLLLAAGLICGLLPALLAILPVIRAQGQDFPKESITLIVLAMLISGAVWIRVAISRAVSTDYLETLRNE